MKPIEVLRYDAFSKTAGQGNPAGIVLEADGLTDWEMQKIAEQAGYNETAFLLPSESADIRIRYFTPGHEMNLCGHATVASLYALLEKGAIEAGAEPEGRNKSGRPFCVYRLRRQSAFFGDAGAGAPVFSVFHRKQKPIGGSAGDQRSGLS